MDKRKLSILLSVIFIFSLPTYLLTISGGGIVPYIYYFPLIFGYLTKPIGTSAGIIIMLVTMFVHIVVYGLLIWYISSISSSILIKLKEKRILLYTTILIYLIGVNLLPIYVKPSHSGSSYQSLCQFYYIC